MKVALSGASSFTAIWIAHALKEKGYEVHALCGSDETSYQGLPKKRIQFLKTITPHIYYNIRAELNSMNEWILEHKPDFWIHHHHHMQDYRSPHYDTDMAKKVGLEPLPYLMENLKNSGAKGVLFSGSYFEPGEGGNSLDTKCTPYSQSKKWVWEEIQKQCLRVELPLSKIVIPNPIGPYENEDRLIPIFIEKTKKSESLFVHTPNVMQDHLPALWLGKIYVQALENQLNGIIKNYRPSGRCVKNREWMLEIQNELIVKRLSLPLIPIECAPASENILTYLNYKNNQEEKIDYGWSVFWDEYAEYTLKGTPLK